ncbi:hypothetical protein DMC30DRAFT_42997 [Rhodotorula diobovata]|uniref:Uncharacterized protein n=1 Tax=Rhodotorula diobovata TaxID=5288 RepID=A0A5C5FPS9_9BASI|nr:hypothetical protein DMC30DRAFT_42997 [Rhodotorula diobovata]
MQRERERERGRGRARGGGGGDARESRRFSSRFLAEAAGHQESPLAACVSPVQGHDGVHMRALPVRRRAMHTGSSELRRSRGATQVSSPPPCSSSRPHVQACARVIVGDCLRICSKQWTHAPSACSAPVQLLSGAAETLRASEHRACRHSASGEPSARFKRGGLWTGLAACERARSSARSHLAPSAALLSFLLPEPRPRFSGSKIVA